MNKALTPYKYKQEKLKEYLIDGYSFNKALELAGYSKSYIQRFKKKILKNVNLEEIYPAMRKHAAFLNLHAMRMAHDWLDSDDPRFAQAAVKVTGDNSRLFFEDKTPTALVFSFQTFTQQNVDNSGGNKLRTDDNNVDNSEVIDITEEVG